MIKFTTFLTESDIRDIENPKNLSDGFINMYSKLTRNEYVYVDLQKFSNTYGKMTGYLYINGLSALRTNFKNGRLHSISQWSIYDSSTPEKTIIFKNTVTKQRLINMFGTVKTALGFKVPEWQRNKPFFMPEPYDHISAKNITELIAKMYAKGFSLNAILEWTKDCETDLNTVFTKLSNYYNGIDSVDDLHFGDLELPVKKTVISKTDTVDDEIIDSDTETVDNEENDITKFNDPDVSIAVSVNETVEDDPSVIANNEELKNQIIADPLPVFEKLNSYVLLVAQRISCALLITGQGGVGKSYNVSRVLSAFCREGKDFVIMKGKCTVPAMYQFLYNNKDKIVVFDDCDSVLCDPEGMSILKSALDTGKIRKITYNKTNFADTFDAKDNNEVEVMKQEWMKKMKIPPSKICFPNAFYFTGQCIFISNMSQEAITRKDDALVTRCDTVDIHLLAEEVMLRIKSCLPSMKIYKADGTDITDEGIKQQVYDFISSDTFLKDPRNVGKDINFRTFNKIYKYLYAKLPNWQKLAYDG